MSAPKNLLITTELYQLDAACALIRRAFGHPPYLVGTAHTGSGTGRYRDVDVRLMLDADEFTAACPTRERWELLCAAVSTYLRVLTGLPIDFQIQQTDIANERFKGTRNPLGLSLARVFAGGGDATPWDAS